MHGVNRRVRLNFLEVLRYLDAPTRLFSAWQLGVLRDTQQETGK